MDTTKEVKTLIEKAAKQDECNSSAAVHFSQAALNTAHAMAVLSEFKIK